MPHPHGASPARVVAARPVKERPASDGVETGRGVRPGAGRRRRAAAWARGRARSAAARAATLRPAPGTADRSIHPRESRRPSSLGLGSGCSAPSRRHTRASASSAGGWRLYLSGQSGSRGPCPPCGPARAVGPAHLAVPGDRTVPPHPAARALRPARRSIIARQVILPWCTVNAVRPVPPRLPSHARDRHRHLRRARP